MIPDELFARERPRLQGLAYRMLGSWSEAEDIVQESYLRANQEAEVHAPRAYLSRIVTHLCLDFLRSARHRRETYVGTWLPEPIVAGPEDLALQGESLRYAFVRLLQELTPQERAAYLLRETLQHDYSEIAAWLEVTPDNCRQLVSRAARRLQQEKPRFSAQPAQVEQLLQGFLGAVRGGDLEGLKGLLHRDMVLWSDGGGKVQAALKPIYGADKVLRFFQGVLPKGRFQGVQMGWFNGLPGLLLIESDRSTVALFEFVEGRLQDVYLVSNPDKLGHIDLGAVQVRDRDR